MKTILCYGLLAVMLTSCGGESTEKSSTQESQNEETTVQVDQTIDITEQEEDTDEADKQEMPASTEKWDRVLDSYESIIEDYDQYITKLSDGDVDMSAMTNIASKSLDLQKELEDAKTELTSNQLQRLSKISADIAKIATKAATAMPNEIESVEGVDIESINTDDIMDAQQKALEMMNNM